MVRTKLLLVFLISAMQIFAGNNAHNRLIEVNAQWLNNPAELAQVSGDYSLFTETEMIQKHLLLVHGILASRSTSGLSPMEQQRRHESLGHLREYAQRGIFPQNITHEERRPVFIDHRGVHCAVGYLIKRSGHPELSQHISESMNFYYLKDMQDQRLNDWVAQSGFSVDELAWIQPGYPKVVNYDAMKGGVSGPVRTLVGDRMGGIYAGGSFDTAGSIHSPHFAQWYSGVAGFDWGFHSTSPNGPVYDVLYHNNTYYVAGSFYAIDTVAAGAAVAAWDGSQWTGLGAFYVGALANYVNDLAIYRDTLYAAGFFRSDASTGPVFTNLAKWNGTKWVKATSDTNLPDFIYGELHALQVHNGKLIVGGEFTLDNAEQTHNIFALNGNTFESFGEDLPYTVYALESYQNELYAGSCYTDSLVGDTAGLSVYRNGQWESVVNFPYGTEAVVYSLESTPDGLVFGGEFMVGNMITHSANLAVYNGNTIGLGVLNGPVRSLLYQNGQLYAGGDFTSGTGSGGPVALGHITSFQLSDYVSVEEPRMAKMKLYPNPAAGTAVVELPEASAVQALKVYDVMGRRHEVSFVRDAHQLQLDLQELTDGIYIIKVQTHAAEWTQRLVVKN